MSRTSFSATTPTENAKSATLIKGGATSALDLPLEGVAKLRFRPSPTLFEQDSDSAQIAYSRPSVSICAETEPVQKSLNLGSKASFTTPSLCVRILCSGDAVIEVKLSLADRFQTEVVNASPDLQKRLETWLSAYLSGIHTPFFKPRSDVPFTQRALDYLPTIPFGQTLTYGEVAEALGSKGGARAVGNACRVNPFPLLVPCHRVVAAGGKLGGFSAGLEIKKLLLNFESHS